MQTSVRVAAVVVGWNSSATIERCLDGLARQSVSFAKVILVDNGSTGIAPRWTGGAEFIFEPHEENLGFAAANNRGLEKCADCDWVALINPDAFLESQWLASMLAASERHVQAASFGCHLLQEHDPTRLDGVGDVVHVSGLAWRAGHGAADASSRSGAEQQVFSACAAAALYRRNALLDVGGFDERFFCYAEDVDLGFRLRLAGYECWYVPAAVALHVGAASSGGKRSRFAVYHGHRNLVWCYIKNMPGLLFWTCLPLHLLANLLSVVLFWGRGMGGVILQAKWHALKGGAEMWRARKAIQRSRKSSAAEIWRLLDKRIVPMR